MFLYHVVRFLGMILYCNAGCGYAKHLPIGPLVSNSVAPMISDSQWSVEPGTVSAIMRFATSGVTRSREMSAG